jgi:repressor LexA
MTMARMMRYERERLLLAFVQKFSSDNGFSPSTREIAEALGFKSVESVHRILTDLKDNGRVTWEPNKARTLKVVNPEVPSTD